MDDSGRDLVHRQIVWASGYDGYRRLTDGPGELARLIEPARSARHDTGRVPTWCGVLRIARR